MPRTFKYSVKITAYEMLRILKDKLKDRPDIEHVGNEITGRMKGKGFEAEYTVTEHSSGSDISITIKKKPLIVPWSLIQSQLDSVAQNW